MQIFRRMVDRLLGYQTRRNFVTSDGGGMTLLHDSGFFSNCSTLLLSLARSKSHPVEIHTDRSFSHYTSPRSRFRWDDCFKPVEAELTGKEDKWASSRVASRLPHHSLYRLIDFKTATSILESYFRLSNTVRSRAAEIQRHLPAPSDKLVALCIRGTDKSSEVRQSRLERYVRLARRLIRNNPGVKVWIQTDQTQLKEELLSKIGPNSFALDVLPTTNGPAVIHKSGEPQNMRQLAIDLVAITWLMSQAMHVITYSGNVGYWIVLFRGNHRRVHQLR